MDLNNLLQRPNETTAEYLERARKVIRPEVYEKILRIKDGSGETIEGAEEMRNAMEATFKHYPDAFVNEVIRQAKENDDT